MSSTPQDTQKAENRKKTGKEAVASAFDSIFKIYPDKVTLSNALNEARSKVEELHALKQEIEARAQSRKTRYAKIENELRNLIANFESDPDYIAQVDVNGDFEDFGPANNESYHNIMGAIEYVAEQSESAVRSKERLRQILVERTEALKFVKMLEAAHGVATSYRLQYKRKREDAPEDNVADSRDAKRLKAESLEGDITGPTAYRVVVLGLQTIQATAEPSTSDKVTATDQTDSALPIAQEHRCSLCKTDWIDVQATDDRLP